MEKSKKPAIRFKGFTDDWEQRKFYELYEKTSRKNDLTYGKNDIISVANMYYKSDSYITDERYLLTYNIFELGDIAFEGNRSKNYAHGRFVENTIGNGIVSHVFDVFKPIMNPYDVLFWKYAINSERLMGNILLRSTKASTMMTNLVASDFLQEEFLVPIYAEQKKIGAFFQHLDNLITLHQRKCDKLVNMKKAMLEKMFPKNGEKVPEIRFKGFTDDWEQRKLGELMNVTSVKRIHQSDWTSSGVRFLRARDIVSEAKNEEPDDYLYISEEKYIEYSAISGKVQVGDLLVTGVGTIGIPLLIRNSEPLYFKDGNIIWFQNNNIINGIFLYYSFWCKQIQDYISESAGIGTVGTYTIDSGKKTPISLPSISEQSKIGRYFVELDNLITLHQRKLEKLKNIKKAMLEKMFV